MRKIFVIGIIVLMFFSTIVFTNVSNVSAETPIRDSNLQLYYSFDDYKFDSGSPNFYDVRDDSRNSNHGTLYGGSSYVSTTKFGRAVRFDGNGDSILSSMNGITGDLTIEAWIFWEGNFEGEADSGTTTTLTDYHLTQATNYWNGWVLKIIATTDGYAPQGETRTVTAFSSYTLTTQSAFSATIDTGDTYCLIGISPNPDGYNTIVSDLYTCGFYIDDNNKLRFESGRPASSNSPDVISVSEIQKNKWTHVAVTRSGSGTSTDSVKLYINGNLDQSGNSYSPSSPSPLTIGRDPIGNFFNGIIDEVKVFDKVLTPADGLGTCFLNLGFEEDDSGSADGDTVFDRSGNELEGNVNGGTWSSQGVYGSRCLDFDGEDDYVNIVDDNNLNIEYEITIEAWIKPDSDITSPVCIVGKWDYGDNERSYFLKANNDNKLIGIISDNGQWDYAHVSRTNSVNDVIVTGIWNHVAMTFTSSTQKVELYINGEKLKGSSVSYDYTSASGIYLSDVDITIGANLNSGSSDQHFDGLIDNVKIYNCVEKIGGEVLLMQFENNLNDESCFGNDGTGYGGITYSNGKFGNGLDLDGINDYALISDADEFSIDTTGELTVEFYLKTPDDIYSRQEIIAKGGQTTSDTYEWSIRISSIGKLATEIMDPNGNNIRRESAKIYENRWYHIGVIFTGCSYNDDIKIYIDGIESSELKTSNSGYTYSNKPCDLGIGRIYKSGSWYYLDGLLDNLIISNYAKTFHEDPDGDGMADIYEIIRTGQFGGDQFNPVEYNGRYTVLFCWAESFWTDIVYNFETLRQYGYSDCDITVLNEDLTAPDHNEYFDDITTTISNFEDVLGTISEWSKASDFVYIYGTGHGEPNAQYTQSAFKDFEGTTEYWDDDFADDIDQITDYHTMVIAIDCCYSGGFIDDICGNDRITLTSAAYNNKAWATGSNPISQFPEYFIGGLSYQTYGGSYHVNVDTGTYGIKDGIVSISEAFNYAIDKNEADSPMSYFMYDDDGIYNNPNDQIDNFHPTTFGDSKPWGNIDGPGMHLPTKDPTRGTYLKDYVVPEAPPFPMYYWKYDTASVTNGWNEGILGGKTFL